MKHLLLDVNVVVDLCVDRSGSANSQLAVALAKNYGLTVWVYAGSVQTLEYVVGSEVRRANLASDMTPSPNVARHKARELLYKLTQDFQWLAALSGEGEVFASENPEDAQLFYALERFSSTEVLLLTRDKQLQENDPQRILSPEAFINFCKQEGITRSIAFVDLAAQQDVIRPALEKNIHTVLQHGQYIMGPEVRELEARLTDYVGVEHCISCASGTDALLMALMALGIGPGDEVITVPYTWISSAEVIALLRARPVFVDILPDSFNLDPDLLEAAISPRTKAIMPVSIYGQCPDMDRINSIAQKYGIPVIEDAAQSFGATYKGRKSCSLTQVGCTSFFPSKPLGGYGDGGAIFTPDSDLAETLRQIRVHGQKFKHQHPLVGLNGRLDTLQAAILLPKLEAFPQELKRRQEIAQRYTELLVPNSTISESNSVPSHRGVGPYGPEAALCSLLSTPHVPQWGTSAWAQYTILAKNRDRLSQHLKASGIPSMAYYTRPLHLQDAFQDLGHQPGNFPVTEQVAAHCLSLPMSPYLSVAEQRSVADAIQRSVEHKADLITF